MPASIQRTSRLADIQVVCCESSLTWSLPRYVTSPIRDCITVDQLYQAAMGASALRDDELEFIEALRVSPEIRKLNDGSHGAMTRAARRVEELYRQKFQDCLPGETDAEFRERRVKKKNAKRFFPETEEERGMRLSKIGQVSPFQSRLRAVVQGDGSVS